MFVLSYVSYEKTSENRTYRARKGFDMARKGRKTKKKMNKPLESNQEEGVSSKTTTKMEPLFTDNALYKAYTNGQPIRKDWYSIKDMGYVYRRETIPIARAYAGCRSF